MDRRDSGSTTQRFTQGDAGAPSTLRETLAAIRADYRNHGHAITHRSVCALVVYRLGRWSLPHRNVVQRVASVVYAAASPIVRFATGVTIDRGMRMGRDPCLQEGGSISIHPHAIVGDRVLIMRNVTLGATPDGGVPRIEDDVVIGAGAVVIGRVTVGHGSRIAANSLVISDVPPLHVAIGVPARYQPLRNSR